MTTRRGRAAPMAPEDRRRAIIDAVVPLLEQHGGDVTTRQIAEAAGIAEGTIFRVFPDKRSLFLAAAEQIVTPPGWRDRMAAGLAAVPGLREKVLFTTEELVSRTRQVLLVLTALRGVLMAEGPPAHLERPPAPPAFLVESGRLLHDALTELVFEPHRDELTVPPATAARALRSLVMGSWHPGAVAADHLAPDEITDLLLHGVACRPAGSPDRRRR